MIAAHKPAPSDPGLLNLMWSQDLERQHGFEQLRIEGTLPASLRGTLYRNGPGQYRQFGTRYSHPFEGDGQTTAIRFADGVALGAAKIHDTRGLLEERAAGKLLYGLSAPWHRRVASSLLRRGKNTANTNIMQWQGRLFALMEAGKPTEVDPRDLRTIGETDLDGVITSFFSAHPHRVASRKATYNFGLEYGRVTKLHMYELPDTGAARHVGAVDLPGPPMLHDFTATDTHLIFFLSPVRVDVPRMLLQLGGFGKMFRWRPEHGTEVICVPIDRPSEVVRFTTESFYQWHFANAHTRGGQLVVDYIRYKDFESFYEIGAQLSGTPKDNVLDQGVLHRATIDLAAKTMRTEPITERNCEFPTLVPGEEGREQSVTFAVFDEMRAIGSIAPDGRVQSHELAANQRISEPLYTGGHLVALCHQRDRAFVAVYDAKRIPDGPVAKVWLDHHVPITFHGTFVPA